MENYCVEKTIANALYGQVLLAHDVRTGDLVAIKKMNAAAAATHTVVRDGMSRVPEDIQVEKQVNRLLRHHGAHPHILRMRDDFVQGDDDHMVFDYCARGDLFDVLEHGALSPPLVKRYFRQIASAVTHLHSNGIAHRDLSLENVLLDAKNNCYVCDFGLATSATMPCDETVGKHFYMAPEVVQGCHYDPAQADVWSLGIMLFMLVTGSPMCMKATPRDSRFAYFTKHGLAKLVASWNIKVDPQVIDLLENMLRVNPSDRFTMQQVVSHMYVGGVRVASPKSVSSDAIDATSAVKAKPVSMLRRLFKRKVADVHSLACN
ncbi:CAMK/CAMKL protein kinase [Aphanomyces invadans]|uniref:CAMK/CAMKL protein kinase n=1 Tax=Aphanomyces invadans TaxID=157072 RepID=A0A024TYJ5_9STRA|nr:CAMK/CAMKL protein kinase [Aphanomyces invadans]ETV98387.1 CAMK/CAMKL protein kinase [Aphanomyces invadans]|eukprot:XP_008873262.1 CAMK/CAMKL protein kinase [Aphanomyces invadans]